MEGTFQNPRDRPSRIRKVITFLSMIASCEKFAKLSKPWHLQVKLSFLLDGKEGLMKPLNGADGGRVPAYLVVQIG